MNIDAEKMDKQEMNLPYEQPSLKKYGTMKKFTLGTAGSTQEGGFFDSDSDSTTIKFKERDTHPPDNTDPTASSNDNFNL